MKPTPAQLAAGLRAFLLAKEAPPRTSPIREPERFVLAIAEAVLADVDVLDGPRLDWLERHPRLSEIHIDGKVTDCYLYGVAGAPGLKLREIIDAAMKGGAG